MKTIIRINGTSGSGGPDPVTLDFALPPALTQPNDAATGYSWNTSSGNYKRRMYDCIAVAKTPSGAIYELAAEPTLEDFIVLAAKFATSDSWGNVKYFPLFRALHNHFWGSVTDGVVTALHSSFTRYATASFSAWSAYLNPFESAQYGSGFGPVGYSKPNPSSGYLRTDVTRSFTLSMGQYNSELMDGESTVLLAGEDAVSAIAMRQGLADVIVAVTEAGASITLPFGNAMPVYMQGHVMYDGTPQSKGTCVSFLGGTLWPIIIPVLSSGSAQGSVSVNVRLDAELNVHVETSWTAGTFTYSRVGVAVFDLLSGKPAYDLNSVGWESIIVK